MAPEDPLLAAIRANWLDRTARLAYADWLQDRDDPRAELVRVCEGMRDEPVWSDRYWELKARRNELWTRVPLDWLEATGYDGSFYDPIFRDGVPDDPLGRWRLIREFTERWHGVAVPDVGGQQEAIRAHEQRLGVTLPPSVREFAAFVHDLDNYGWENREPHAINLFHSAAGELEWFGEGAILSLIYLTLSDDVLGVTSDSLGAPDPPAWYFNQHRSDEWYYETPGHAPPSDPPPVFCAPSVSLATFGSILTELPTAGGISTAVEDPNGLLARLVAGFPIRAKFDDTNVFESDELMVVLYGPRGYRNEQSVRRMTVLVRRRLPLSALPDFLFVAGPGGERLSGWGICMSAEHQRMHAASLAREWWASVLRRAFEQAREAEPPHPGQAPVQNWPQYEDGDDIPF